MVLNKTLRVHQCHCTYSSEMWTCINIDAGRQAAHKKNTCFLIESRKTTLFTHVSMKKKFKKKINKLTGTNYPFKQCSNICQKAGKTKVIIFWLE